MTPGQVTEKQALLCDIQEQTHVEDDSMEYSPWHGIRKVVPLSPGKYTLS